MPLSHTEFIRPSCVLSWPQDSVVVQLMPYGWNVTRPEDKGERVVRAECASAFAV